MMRFLVVFAVLAPATAFAQSEGAPAPEADAVPSPFDPPPESEAPPPEAPPDPGDPAPIQVVDQPAECVPACRDGFVCHQGQCISACNPPCGAGQRCSGAGMCVAAQAAPIAPVSQPAPTGRGPTADPRAAARERRREVRSRVRIGIHVGAAYQRLYIPAVVMWDGYDDGEFVGSDDLPEEAVDGAAPSLGIQVRGYVGTVFGWQLRLASVFLVASEIRETTGGEGRPRVEGDVGETRIFGGVYGDATVRAHFGAFFLGAGAFGGYQTLIGDEGPLTASQGYFGGLGELGFIAGGDERVEVAARGGGGIHMDGTFQLAMTIALN